MSLFLLSCNNEDPEKNSKSVNLNQVKKDLKLNKFSNVNIAENVAINWESIKETEKDNFKIFEITAHEKTASTLESEFLHSHLKYQIVTIESKGQLYSYFVEAYSNKGSNIYPETITKLNDFTGTLNVFLLNGENLGSVAIYKGEARNISENNDLNVLAESINAFAAKSDATNKMPQCGGNYTVFIDQTLSRFDVWTVAGEIIAVNYVGTTTTRTSSIMPFPCDGVYDKNDILNQRLESYNYKNGSGGSVTVATVITDSSFSNNPCLSGVFNKLGGSLIFQNYLKKFDSKFSVANLKLLASSTLPNNINAETESPVNYLVNITFNENNLNRPTLSIARTFIHEMIHAEIYRKLLSVAGQPQIQFNQNQLNQLKNDYPGLYDYYMRYEFNVPTGQNLSDAQHEAMAMHYRDIIEQALRQLDNTLSSDTYEALAWEGLKSTKAWEKLPTAKQQSILLIISNFNKTNSNCQ